MGQHSRTMNGWMAGLLVLVLMPGLKTECLVAQSKQQIESRLQQMSPEEIDKRLKEYGVTREEAEVKAKEYGVDLPTYLMRKATEGVSPATAKPAAENQVTVSVPLQASESEKVPASPAITSVKAADPQSGLRFFGYDVFERTPAGFEPTASGPVDPQYLLGPGDVVRISVWGQTEFQYELVIDNEGKIFIPTVGPILLSGLTLEQANPRLIKMLSKSYAGLNSQPPTSYMDVTISKLRPKRIFIMGEVENPGGYTVSSYSNIFSSLFSVGGPKTSGSLRDVRLIRNGKTIAQVDLYAYFRGAATITDVRVQNNDIIFVPPRGRTVALSGEVIHPAVYELKEKEQIRELVAIAGGLKSAAFIGRAELVRVRPFKDRKPGAVEDRSVTDINLTPLTTTESWNFELNDADHLTIRSILDVMENFVLLNGAVWRPGRFEIEKVRTVRELVKAGDGILPKAYAENAQLIRFNKDRITRSVTSIDLGRILKGEMEDPRLEPRDELIVFSREAVEVKERSVRIYGEVKVPGTYQLHDGMTLRELILLAGGFTEAAELSSAEVSRLEPKGIGGDTLAHFFYPKLTNDFDVTHDAPRGSRGEIHEKDEDSFLLGNHDVVLIRPNPDYIPQRIVSIEGEIRYPGSYAMRKQNERLSELVNRAGGLTKYAFLDGGYIVRGDRRLNIDFLQLLGNRDSRFDFILRSGDRVIFPQIPNIVSVSGEVNNVSNLGFVKGHKLWDYIDRAGGLTDSSNYVLLRYPSGSVEKFHTGFLLKIFESNPVVADGSSITVTKEPPPRDSEKIDYTSVIKETFAIVVSSMTIIVLAKQF